MVSRNNGSEKLTSMGKLKKHISLINFQFAMLWVRVRVRARVRVKKN
jgi:hypothetical protein